MQRYDSKTEFFRSHLFSSSRHTAYDQFLLKSLPKSARTLSIASGRAANELRLQEEGWNILCSDLEPVCLNEARRLFPAFNPVKWNCMTDPPIPEKFDVVLSLSFVYLLDAEKLCDFFNRVREQLAPTGLFVLDAASSPDHWIANLLHDFFLPVEAYLLQPALNLCWKLAGRKGVVVQRKHHGFRYTDLGGHPKPANDNERSGH